ncbi:MAG: methyl-accepting chemotaxis protein [Pseudomonadota bacterium]
MGSLFSPAIELMHRLKYPYKFMLIGALAFGAIIFLVVPLAANLNGTINVSQNELAGVEIDKPLLKLIQQVQQHRALSASVLNGKEIFKEKLTTKDNEILEAVKAVDTINTKYSAVLNVSGEWKKTKEKWEGLRTGGLNMSPSDNFSLHTELIADFLGLIALVGDSSGLILDPDANSYYLMDISTGRLPDLLERLGRIRGMGMRALTKQTIDEQMRREFIGDTAVLRKLRDDLDQSLKKAATYNPSLAPRVGTFGTSFGEAINKILLTLNGDIISGKFSVTPEAYYAQTSETIDLGYRQIEEAIFPELEVLLHARIAEIKRLFYIEIGIALIAVFLFAYFAVGAYLSIMSTLKLLNQGADRIASGDLTVHIKSDTKDELRQVAERFNNMIDSVSQLIRKIRTEAMNVSSSAATLATSAGNVSDGSAEQSEAAASMAAAVEEMTVSVGEINRHANQAQSISQKSGELSAQGNEIVNTTAQEMTAIAETVNKSAEIIQDLGRQSQKISAIVNAIKEIADQTNLLALNAAIEAARAGETGRGFAVVADEVRKLAERTGKATQEIGDMISAIQNGTNNAVNSMQQGVARVNQGVSYAQRAGSSMKEVSEGASHVVRVIGDISVALKEQSVASSDIAKNVERIAQMADRNHSAVAETATTARELERLAGTLQHEINRFQVR